MIRTALTWSAFERTVWFDLALVAKVAEVIDKSGQIG